MDKETRANFKGSALPLTLMGYPGALHDQADMGIDNDSETGYMILMDPTIMLQHGSMSRWTQRKTSLSDLDPGNRPVTKQTMIYDPDGSRDKKLV